MCIRRNDMPQVDAADLPSLMAYLHTKGYTPTERTLPVNWLRPMQCLDPLRENHDPDLRKRPILISLDLAIIDGNHRWGLWMLEDATADCNCIQLPCSFEEARKVVMAFPKAYTIGYENAPA